MKWTQQQYREANRQVTECMTATASTSRGVQIAGFAVELACQRNELLHACKGAEIMLGFLLEFAERHPNFDRASTRNANVTRCALLDAIAKAEGK